MVKKAPYNETNVAKRPLCGEKEQKAPNITKKMFLIFQGGDRLLLSPPLRAPMSVGLALVLASSCMGARRNYRRGEGCGKAHKRPPPHMAKNAPLAYIIRRENGKMVVKMPPPPPPGGKPRNFPLSKEKRPP